jgi:hypothetical protein
MRHPIELSRLHFCIGADVTGCPQKAQRQGRAVDQVIVPAVREIAQLGQEEVVAPTDVRSVHEALREDGHDGIAFNEVFAGEDAMIYKDACALGCEGIVSRRLGSPYRAGRSDRWLKIKNPAAPAVRRLEEEDWNG